MKDSIKKTLLLRTIEANIRTDVVVDGFEFSTRGRYEEQALDHAPPEDLMRSMFRLDLNFLMDTPSTPGSEPNRMTIVCNIPEDKEKAKIWKYTSIEGQKLLRFVRIAEVERAVKNSKTGPAFQNMTEIRNLGGIVGMLRQIDRFYSFESPPVRQDLEGEKKIAAWKVEGKLRKEQLDRILPLFGGMGKKNTYPKHLPTDIEVWFGLADGFPYKIRYLNRPSEKKTHTNLLTQVFYFDVILNGEPIPAFKFATFDKNETPDGVYVDEDETDVFIGSLAL